METMLKVTGYLLVAVVVVKVMASVAVLVAPMMVVGAIAVGLAAGAACQS